MKHWEIFESNFISFYDGTTREINKLRRLTEGSVSGLKLFQIKKLL